MSDTRATIDTRALGAMAEGIADRATSEQKMRQEIDRLRLALEKVKAIYSNRKSFDTRAPGAFAMAERVARDALEGNP